MPTNTPTPPPSATEIGRRVVRGVTRAVRNFLVEENGATAVEYAVICALIIVSVITGITVFGGASADLYNGINGSISSFI